MLPVAKMSLWGIWHEQIYVPNRLKLTYFHRYRQQTNEEKDLQT